MLYSEYNSELIIPILKIMQLTSPLPLTNSDTANNGYHQNCFQYCLQNCASTTSSTNTDRLVNKVLSNAIPTVAIMLFFLFNLSRLPSILLRVLTTIQLIDATATDSDSWFKATIAISLR